MFEGIGRLFNTMLVCCIIFIPLGLWKLAEIIIWLWRHVHVSYQ